VPLRAAGAAPHKLLSGLHPDTLADDVLSGDIVIGSLAPLWARRPKGSDGQFLKLVGGLPSWADPPGAADHNLLSTTHPDTLVASVLRGDLLVGNLTPKWARAAIGSANAILKTDGLDPLWGLLVNANVDALAAIAESKLALNYATHARQHALDSALDHTGVITDSQHGSRGSGLHGDSHARSHALDSALDHTGIITDAQHGSRGSGLHADSHTRLHTMTDALDHTGSINDSQHGSRGSGLHADSHPQLHNTSHQDGGGDEISVAALSGRLADFQPFPFLDFYRKVGATANRYYGPMIAGATATAAMTLNVIYASPFAVVKTITLDRIAINVTTAAAGATARLGIYADDGTTYPGSLVLDAGTVDVSTTGMKTITISQELTPGLYWLCVWSGGGPTIRGVAGGGAYPILSLDSTLAAAVYNRYEATLTYGSYPSTFPAGASAGSGAMPCPWVRLSA